MASIILEENDSVLKTNLVKNENLGILAEEYINANFSSDLTLASLAEQVNMNPVYISSLFKKNFGFTFKEYLLNFARYSQ